MKLTTPYNNHWNNYVVVWTQINIKETALMTFCQYLGEYLCKSTKGASDAYVLI